MVVLRLRGDALHRQGGATVMLRSLLRVLLTRARTEHVPMRQGALEAAEAALEQPIDTRERHVPGFAILEFLEAVEVPVLVLCDEAQSLFLPTIGGKPDTCGAEYTRDSFLKQLLVYGSHTTLRCITGSSMAHTWVNLADMPTYGHPVITSASAPDLPVTYSSRHMHLAWELLQGQFPHVPSDPKLLQLCPPSVALLTALVTSWINAGHPEDAVAFVDESVRAKLVGESRKDWKLALEGLPTSERLAVLDMASPAVGARIEHLHFGLRRFLQPHVGDKEDGSCFFRDAHQRQIMRLLLNKDGTLRESWSDLEFSATLMQLDGGWNLFYLGEAADYLLGPNASRRWEHEEPPAELDEFKAVMQAVPERAGQHEAVES